MKSNNCCSYLALGLAGRSVLIAGFLSIVPLTASATAITAMVSHSPAQIGPMAIPTMGGAALLALSLLLAVVAWRAHRMGVLRGNSLLGVSLMIAVLTTGVSGVRLVQAQVNGGSAPIFNLTDPEGGTINLVSVGGTHCVVNSTGVAQEIRSITAQPGFEIDEDGSSRDGFCSEIAILREGESQPTEDLANAGEAPVCSVSPPTQLAPYYACSVTALSTF